MQLLYQSRMFVVPLPYIVYKKCHCFTNPKLFNTETDSWSKAFGLVRVLLYFVHYSFPGGLADSSDGSPERTALREAEEELGIRPHNVEVWGQLTSCPDRRRTSMVTPVLGYVQKVAMDSLRVNQAEVGGKPMRT